MFGWADMLCHSVATMPGSSPFSNCLLDFGLSSYARPMSDSKCPVFDSSLLLFVAFPCLAQSYAMFGALKRKLARIRTRGHRSAAMKDQ